MSVDGKWKVTMTSPHGAREADVDFVTAGGKLTGTWSGPEGSPQDFTGSIEGRALYWTIKRSGPMGEMVLEFNGTVDGDKVSGTVEIGQMGSTTFEGSRA
jgi:hypothetical protein